MAKSRETYEIFDPKLVGRKSEIVIGKTSGKTGVDAKLKEIGIVFDQNQLGVIYDTVKARVCSGRINDEEIKKIAMQVLKQKPDLLSSKV
jgi:isopropylmalate/homocitrate/citramalate synthase